MSSFLGKVRYINYTLCYDPKYAHVPHKPCISVSMITWCINVHRNTLITVYVILTYSYAHNDTVERGTTSIKCRMHNCKQKKKYGIVNGHAFIVVCILTVTHSTGKVSILGDAILRNTRMYVKVVY